MEYGGLGKEKVSKQKDLSNNQKGKNYYKSRTNRLD